MQEPTKEKQAVEYAVPAELPRRHMLGKLARAAATLPLAGLLLPSEAAQAAPDLKKNFLGMIQAWNDHDSAKIAGFFVDDCTYTDIALEVVHHGKNEVMAFADGTFVGFPDFSLVILSCFAGHDSVAAEWDMIMSWKGPYPGMEGPPNGKTYRLKGASVSHFNKKGKIVRNTDYWNMGTFLRQIKES